MENETQARLRSPRERTRSTSTSFFTLWPRWEYAPPPPVREYSTSAPPPPLTPEEPQWGFDEAQIETARRADVPMSRNEKPKPPTRESVKKAAKSNRWIGALIAGVVIIILGF